MGPRCSPRNVPLGRKYSVLEPCSAPPDLIPEDIDPPHTVQFVNGVSTSVIELHSSMFAALQRLCGYRPRTIEAGGCTWAPSRFNLVTTLLIAVTGS